MLLMQHRRNQVAVRGQHKPAQLREDGHILHTGRLQNGLILPANPFPNGCNVTGRLFRPVVHTHAAREIDKGNVEPGCPVKPHSQAEQLGSQFRIILVTPGIAGKQRVNPKLPGALLRQALERPCHLILRHAILGIPGHIHDGVA